MTGNNYQRCNSVTKATHFKYSISMHALIIAQCAHLGVNVSKTRSPMSSSMMVGVGLGCIRFALCSAAVGDRSGDSGAACSASSLSELWSNAAVHESVKGDRYMHSCPLAHCNKLRSVHGDK